MTLKIFEHNGTKYYAPQVFYDPARSEIDRILNTSFSVDVEIDNHSSIAKIKYWYPVTSVGFVLANGTYSLLVEDNKVAMIKQPRSNAGLPIAYPLETKLLIRCL